MIETRTDDWHADNQASLIASIEHLHDALAGRTGRPAPIAAWPGWPALEDLVAVFDLDPFARQIILLAAATELDGRLLALLAEPDAPDMPAGLTVATLFRLCPDAHWTALAPQSPLRLLQLIDTDESQSLASRPIRLTERILHYLLAVPALDTRLAAVVQPMAVRPVAVTYAATAERLAQRMANEPRVQVTGGDALTRRTHAMATAQINGTAICLLAQADLPQSAGEREAFIRLWTCEALLTGALLAIELDDPSPAVLDILGAIVRRLPTGLLVLSAEPVPAHLLEAARFELPVPDMQMRRCLWQDVLGDDPEKTAGLADRLAGQFRLPFEAMQASLRAARAAVEAQAVEADGDPSDEGDIGQAMWNAARDQARPRIANLAERIDVTRGWDDIVLPALQMATLHAIAAHTTTRGLVYEDWGFGEKLSARGLGITALFAGPSGTGKTLAAEVIAGALALDLYRVDLSSVVSKYIGETEKNLGRIFDAAETGGAILLFDEADALFGKRSEVKDSHDRYANIEVSYLLQRMETYSGLAILTTNLKGNLDGAFLRRLRFIVDFPFPSNAERLQIWQRAFPVSAPLGNVDLRRLAQLNVPGGAIRNIALNAAFLAAGRGGVIEMADLMAAAQNEYGKLEKPLTASEIRGWKGAP